MLELEELKDKYIKYSEEITEDTFNKILDRAKEFAKEICPDLRTYGSFDDHSFDSFRLNKFFRFSGSSCSYGVDNNSQDAVEIKVSDILGEETKFEVGKWYSFYWNWSSGNCIGKVCQVNTYEKTVIQFDNYTSNNSPGKLFTDGRTIDLAEIENIKELNLEEIQQYLPDNHPDKIVKPIGKWSVGSYVVWEKFLNGMQYYSFKPKFGIPYKIEEKLSNTTIRILGKAVDTSYEHNSDNLKWFATLQEAEAFSKELLEPKSLTVNDLVKGEIYKTQINDKTYLIRVINKLGGYDLCLIISSESPKLFREAKNVSWRKIESPTPEEAKWFIVCEKQDKPIPKEDLSEYDSEGNLIKMKEYVHCETQEQWNFVLSKFNPSGLHEYMFNTYKSIGIDLRDGCCTDTNWYDKNGYKKVTFQEWLNLNDYTFEEGSKEKFKIGDYVVSLIDTYYGRKKGDLLLITGGDSYRIVATRRKEFFNGTITNGEVAESLRKATPEEIALVVKPKSKEFDKNWYVEVNSQEEADLVFDWLRAQGEPVIDADRMLEFRVNIDKYITYWKEGNSWIVNNNSAKNAYQKQLSDILPNYSKVDRNVYYEVENQKQYLEILDWLESNGEQANKGYDVIAPWKYICFEDGEWGLNRKVKPNLSKAEFQFKGKSEKQPIKTGGGLMDLILQNQYQYEYKTIDSSSVWETLMNPPTQNSTINLKQEPIKLLSFEEDDVVLFKTNSVKISNEQLIIND